MIELEVLVEVYSSYEQALHSLSQLKLKREDLTEDIYYYDPLRPKLQPENNKLNASFRLRNRKGESYITYKDDHFSGDKWIYSDEFEIQISDFNIAREIINRLGLKELVILKNLKRVYLYKDYEVVLEKVDNLGVFLEVELKKSINEKEVYTEKNNINNFIESLGINCSSELNCGKPELFIRKHGKTNS